jgi:hypothetical protein
MKRSSKKGSFVIKSPKRNPRVVSQHGKQQGSKSKSVSRLALNSKASQFKILKLKQLIELETYSFKPSAAKNHPKKGVEGSVKKSWSLPPNKFKPGKILARSPTRKTERKEFFKSFGQKEQIDQVKSPKIAAVKPSSSLKKDLSGLNTPVSLNTINLGQKSEIIKLLKRSRGIKDGDASQNPELDKQNLKLNPVQVNMLKGKISPQLIDKVGSIFKKGPQFTLRKNSKSFKARG